MCDGHIEQPCAWPTCGIHYDLVNDFGDFYSWSWESMYWPHGPVHFWLGGFLDCAQPYDKMAHLVGSTMANTFAAYSCNHRKALYWDEIWYCEGTVDEDMPPGEVSIFRFVSSGRQAVDTEVQFTRQRMRTPGRPTR